MIIFIILLSIVINYYCCRTPAHFPRGYGRYPPPFYLYPSPTTNFPSSPLYSVAVQFFYNNGTAATPLPESSHVYYNSILHRSQYPGADNARQDQSVSWTSFAFDASRYWAKIFINTSFPIRSCTLRPLSYNLLCSVTYNSTSFTIDIRKSPLKISVELEAPSIGNDPPGPQSFVAQPLFLFPDPPEDPALIPPSNDPGVLYFPRGIHNFTSIGQTILSCGQNNVYLEPGAYVIGGFRTSCEGNIVSVPEAVVFSGRGIISGETFPWKDSRFGFGLINIDKSKGSIIDGLTIIDSPRYHLRTYTEDNIVRNVKLFGSWPFEANGLDIGKNGLVEDTFIRANDDSLTLPGSTGGKVRRIVIWQMLNGAVFQLGWNAVLNFQDIDIEDIDVIHMDYCHLRTPGWCSVSSINNNNGFLVLSPPGTHTMTISNIQISRVRIEVDVGRFLYVPAVEGTKGSLTDFHLKDISMAKYTAPGGAVNYLGSLSSDTTMDRWTFENITVNGKCWKGTGDANMIIQGSVSNVAFFCPRGPTRLPPASQAGVIAGGIIGLLCLIFIMYLIIHARGWINIPCFNRLPCFQSKDKVTKLLSNNPSDAGMAGGIKINGEVEMINILANTNSSVVPTLNQPVRSKLFRTPEKLSSTKLQIWK